MTTQFMLPGIRSPTSSTESCSSPENDLSLSRGTAFGLSVDDEDLHYFDHFRHHAIHDLASVLDAELWQSYILRSASKPAVMHAISALSAQHELFLRSGHTATSRNLLIKDPTVAYSWKHYTRAIRQLHHGINNAANDGPTPDETIVTCLLLIFFEVLRGEYPTALMHLEAGLQIFSTYYSSVKRSSVTNFGQDDPLHGLAQIFKRLDIQASSYIGDRSVSAFSVPYHEICSEPLSLPFLLEISMEFDTIRDAQEALDGHVAHIFKFMRSTGQSLQGDPLLESQRVFELKYNSTLRSGGAHCSTLMKVIEERQHYLQALRAWAYSFEAFLGRSATAASHREGASADSLRGEQVQQCAVIWISYLVTFIILSTCIEPDESSYDEYITQFKEIINHARSVLLTDGEKTRNAGRRLSLEMSVVYPLSITAFKCRDSTVRRHAISLLHISGQEGVWNGKMLATMAEHVVEYEESHAYVDVGSEGSSDAESLPRTPPDCGWVAMDLPEHDKAGTMIIPEIARVHGVHPDLSDPGTGSLWLEYSTRDFIVTEGEDETGLIHPTDKYEWVFHKAFLKW